MSSAEFIGAARACFDIVIKSNASVRLRFFAACAFDVLTVFVSVAAPAVLKTLIDSLNDQSSNYNVAWLGVAYGLTWMGAELLLRIRAIITTDVIEKARMEAARRFCLNTIFRSNPKATEIPSGVFAAKLNLINSALPIFIDGLMWQILPLMVRLALSISMLIQFVPVIYSLLLALSVLAFMVVSFLSYKSIGDKQREANISAQGVHWRILDALKNKTVIIAHADENKELRFIERFLSASTKSAIGAVVYAQLVSSVQVILLGAGLIAITVLAAMDLSGGAITMGEFVQVNAYVLQFVLPVSYFGMVLSGIKRASVTLGENAQYLERSSTTKMQSAPGKSDEPPTIRLNNVYVKSSEGQPLLKGISFEISKGEILAVVGESGAGKSTLVKAIIGLNEVDSGDVRINQESLSQINLYSFRQNIGYASQEPFLFDRSILENIFNDGESRDQEELERILKISGIGVELDIAAPNGCISLSGGEKQRVSFARAIARCPGIIILDEPTSSLDSATKQVLSSAIFTTLRGVTRIIITHDLEEASKADHILVLERGEIIEYGTHRELLMAGGWYSNHWELSSSRT